MLYLTILEDSLNTKISNNRNFFKKLFQVLCLEY